jgi:anti-sigma B factor antagonist
VSAVQSLALAGELTIQTAAERKITLVEALEHAEQAGATGLDLDLAEVTELDTAGLQLLLMLQREAAHRGCRVRLAAMSQTVTDVLAIAHLDAGLDRRVASVVADRTIDPRESAS